MSSGAFAGFSCKRRGFCPSCGARRLAESAALLVDDVIPDQPVRQWVLSIPIPLRFLFANRPSVMSGVLRLVYRFLSSWVIKQAGLMRKAGQTGAVTLIQRFGSALNLNLHYHLLFLDVAYTQGESDRLEFRRSRESTSEELTVLAETLARRIGRYLTRRGYLTQDAVSGWNDPRDLRSIGFYSQIGSADTETEGEPDALPWGCLFRPSCPPPLRGQPLAVQNRSRRFCAPNSRWREQVTPGNKCNGWWWPLFQHLMRDQIKFSDASAKAVEYIENSSISRSGCSFP